MINSAFASVNGDKYPYRAAFYGFEQTGNDSYVNGYNLAPSGTLSYTTPGIGGNYSCGVFTDSNFFVMPAGIVNALNAASFWSFEFYIKLNSTMSFAQLIANANNQFSLTVAGNGLRWNNLALGLTGGAVTTNTWYMVAYVLNGTSRSIYLNNLLVASDSNGAVFGTAVTDVGKNPTAPNFFFDGWVDNMKICIYPNAAAVPTNFPTNF